MVYVTHDHDEAMTLADKIVLRRDSRIEHFGSPIVLFERPANAFVNLFIRSPKMNFFEASDQASTASSAIDRTVAAGKQVGLRPEHLAPTGSLGFR